MNTLFLNPPSFRGYDGGAGSRYQARREIRSFWYPTWLAQAAALVDSSRVVDAPADDLGILDVLHIARDYKLVIIYTSTPSFANDASTATLIKKRCPDTVIGFVGPHVSVLPDESLTAAPAVDFVVRKEFEIPVQQVAQGEPLAKIDGLTWRDGENITRNPDAPILNDLNSLPYVVDVYKRDLTIENYYNGYLMHPYLSIYTGRGCPAQCSYCLWPQTMSGHDYRVRSSELVYNELAMAKQIFPQVKEYFIDDDTFTANPRRAAGIGALIKDLGITWSTSSRVSASYDTLKALKESGLRLLLVGFESGSDEILRNCRKGIDTGMSRRFMHDCKNLGIAVHGTFMLGLPGENINTIKQTMDFARELDPDTIQVSIAAPYPGTALYKQAKDNGWLNEANMVSADGTQTCAMMLEGISNDEVMASVDKFYRQFYFRPRVMMRMIGEMIVNADVRKRRLREGREFVSFLHRSEHASDQQKVNIKRIIKDGGPGFCNFAVTDACNASCAFCNFRKDYDTGAARSFVDLHESCAAIDVMAANGIQYISFVGGEPTLHSGLPQMISHAKQHKMHTMICTNGWLLSPERIGEYANAGLDSCIISVDAPNIETHEANRGLKNLCERIMDANVSFKKAGIPTTASVTLSKLLGDINQLPDFLTSLGFERVTFSYPLQTLDSSFRGCAESELIEYTPYELINAFQDILSLHGNMSVVNPKASLKEMQRFVRGGEQRFECLAGLKYFYLDWKFDLYRCHAWHEPMCSIWDFDHTKTIRDGCTKCMIDCYRDASVLQHIAVALHDAGKDLHNGHVGAAVKKLVNRAVYESAKSVLEERAWIKGL